MKDKGYSFPLVALAAAYCVALVVSNVIAGKLYQAPGGIVLPAAVWLFPVVYIIGDVIPEVYGLATARRIIALGFAANLAAVGFFVLTLALPAPESWAGQEAFRAVLGSTPRLLLASLVGYLVGTNANAWVLVRIKRCTGERWLWLRTIGSTIVGETLDSACFMSIAFLGAVPASALPAMVLAQAAFKTAYEALATPLTYAVIGAVKRAEAGA
ncbi:MAG TPA: queuosine precursor transporter [Anaerolineae bacterium]|nr:queuosine precursor transporter [Anaerolineae bacterium]HOG47346.1 queuosine precursor transporter [Anaerolineae bacterium]HOQ99005.1 queuosine precursor transporter [Anaerolineae bacterium]HPL30619.1 queuosine precursor transporter [Anaerolineae bacterium]